MAAVTEQDPREGLGEEIDEFVAWLEEQGIKGTDAVLRRVAGRAFVSRSTIYSWRSGATQCQNILTAKTIRDAIADEKKTLG